ncbi:MAG: pantoate--beta-alanine ligase [Candidatus Kapabacteria bacterium]|nr:pantoate--beta-alanine ligase [Candidatus Kapabacteria bacterium]MCS7169121.1 pantoate--beta-alanine ligase [Candidatus Kapabacteria bacterium]MDW7997777.1 pantoate--beta-alanine ligase [Bacteroidota bacterium]MDW8225337.1 pantoate--beta-alanine ligase [Bacteroidota bacterium]
MELIVTVHQMQQYAEQQRCAGRRIAVVPTMGYFHEGHLSLIRRARQLADTVITTLFVNPTQFAPGEDYQRYPRDLERDSQLAERSGCDVLFAPSLDEVYPQGYATTITVHGITEKFEGAFRPGHFQGVATIVAKLFLATKPHVAVFGQKDWQQTLVVRQLVRDLNFAIEIVVAPTVREPDGLAMSSRNVYLSPGERQKATVLYRALQRAHCLVKQGERRRLVLVHAMEAELRQVPELSIDYAAAAEAMTLEEPEEFTAGQTVVLLVAARIGATRLIDNDLVQVPSSEDACA